jgi:hypothetical protein
MGAILVKFPVLLPRGVRGGLCLALANTTPTKTGEFPKPILGMGVQKIVKAPFSIWILTPIVSDTGSDY